MTCRRFSSSLTLLLPLIMLVKLTSGTLVIVQAFECVGWLGQHIESPKRRSPHRTSWGVPITSLDGQGPCFRVHLFIHLVCSVMQKEIFYLGENWLTWWCDWFRIGWQFHSFPVNLSFSCFLKTSVFWVLLHAVAVALVLLLWAIFIAFLSSIIWSYSCYLK